MEAFIAKAGSSFQLLANSRGISTARMKEIGKIRFAVYEPGVSLAQCRDTSGNGLAMDSRTGWF